nr:RNA-directed DNA polymerase, eukaryota, reverse transcriptase zinc-binding domain protein [Tanacetum cinerariifolium]
YKVDLEALDTIIDQGNGNVEIVKQRSEIVSKLLHIDKLSSVEMAQKAKVKWSKEGDENTSFFHGVINKKRNLLNIRCIMVDGSWVDEPSMVKREFFNHFRNRFDKPDGIHAITHMEYPRRISLDKQSELEGVVSNDEIKRAVWDCRADKAPGPDGFTFGFYRRFWASGLKINMSKSKILGVHVESDRVKEAVLRLGCLTLKTPFLYLGSKVGGSMSRLHEWDEVVERVKMRLSKWKMKSLSIGGRLTLLKSVLGSMTIYNMSILKVPLGVLRTLELIRSHFFNGHALGSNKASWVSWKKVLSSKDKGGLGVSSLYALNRGLLFKWIWRFYTQDKSLWVRVIKAMYRDKGKIDAEVKTGSRSCWLNIIHEAKILTQKGITLRDFMRIKPGNEENTSFWENCWIEGNSLRNRFPRLYTLESCKRITVGEKMRQPSLEFSFRRNIRGGVEQEQLRDLVTLMHDVSLSPMADRWIKYVPTKVNVNAWKVKLDALPTRFNVSRRGIHIDSIMCAVCDQGVETSRHLFFSCNMVRQTTRMITRWWDVSYEDFVDYDDWRTWIINLRLPSKNKMMLEGFGVCPRKHDPKIVRIVYKVNDTPLVYVFSLALGLWKKPFNQNCLHKMIHVSWNQVCLNGVIHWIACDKRNGVKSRSLIVSFDLVREEFSEMLLPDGLASLDVLNMSISERKGCLSMVEYDMEKGRECCGVWVMKEYGVTRSWGKMCFVRLPGMLRRVVGFRVNGDVVMALKNHELVSVECSGNIKSFGIHGNIRSFFVGSYVESLIMVDQVDQKMYPVHGDDKDNDACAYMEESGCENNIPVS